MLLLFLLAYCIVMCANWLPLRIPLIRDVPMVVATRGRKSEMYKKICGALTGKLRGECRVVVAAIQWSAGLC